MTKQDKINVVEDLVVVLQESPNVYVADAGGLTVEEVNSLRKLCFDAGVKMQVVKNTLLQKALDKSESDYSELYPVLKQQSSVFFSGEENTNAPAKVLEKFRKEHTKPLLKGAWVGEAVFIGDDQIKTLASLKSKNELLGELIGLLQSPAKNVISGLKSSGGKLAGILKTLSEREA